MCSHGRTASLDQGRHGTLGSINTADVSSAKLEAQLGAGHTTVESRERAARQDFFPSPSSSRTENGFKLYPMSRKLSLLNATPPNFRLTDSKRFMEAWKLF
jgi:hypothetical protein